ncbi:nuclear transport factor 2 family protein [Roseivirga echinicomitans]
MSIQGNRELIDKFYTAFAQKNVEVMNACYAKQAVFEDPAFGKLKDAEITSMWSMLVERGGNSLIVTHRILAVTNSTVKAQWTAIYPFSKTLRMVHNKITADFIIEDGKIVNHKDHFNMWKWCSMALGLPGMLLGWTGFMKNKVRKTALSSLHKYMQK